VKIKLKKESARKYRRLWASRNDLELARAYAAHLIKKGWFEPEWARRQRIYFQQQAFTTALVVSYARAFLDPKDWEQYLLKHLPYDEIGSERLVLHQYLMKLRNQLFAHSDLRSVDVQPGRFPDKEFGEIPGEYRIARGVTLTADQLRLLLDHAEEIIIDINGEMLMTGTDSLSSLDALMPVGLAAWLLKGKHIFYVLRSFTQMIVGQVAPQNNVHHLQGLSHRTRDRKANLVRTLKS
jgi:hypothetical protein